MYEGLMTRERAEAVYDILVLLGGADEHMRQNFTYSHVEEKRGCSEYRFGGYLGFGGKYRSERNRVDYYPEDETPKMKRIAQQINEALEKIEGEK